MNTKITIGEYNILSSGTLLVEEGVPITFDLGDSMICIFKFLSDKLKGDNITRQKKSDGNLCLEFINFDSEDGVSNTEPIKLGSFGGRDLYLTIRINSMPKNQGRIKHIYYMWLLKDKSKVECDG